MNNKLTVSFKKDELASLKKFKEKYSSPSAIIKDFIKKDVSFDTSQQKNIN